MRTHLDQKNPNFSGELIIAQEECVHTGRVCTHRKSVYTQEECVHTGRVYADDEQ